jgi:hypothetical protein
MQRPYRCPVCGDSVCGRHYEADDPEGHRRMLLHKHGNHVLCSPRGCVYKEASVGR